MMKMIKRWWFYLAMPIMVIGALIALGGKKDLQNYKDYIFYGIAQNKVSDGKLKINFTTKNFPHRRHTVYVEIIFPDGSIDFVSSEEHTKNHKAHKGAHGKTILYKASYKLPTNLPKGKYKLRVRFEFDTPGWGRLNRDMLISNDVKFEIK